MTKLQLEKPEVPMKPESECVEVWGDNVNLKDLLFSIIICTITTLGGYLIAPAEPPKPLIYGLIGGIIGFIVVSIIIKPKRIISIKEEG